MSKGSTNNTPKVRFPEFKKAGAWEEKRLEDKFSSYSGGTPTTHKKEYYGGDIPFIRSAEINRRDTELFLTAEGLSNSSARLIQKGDVLIALYGANSGDIAISKLNGAINQAILCLKSKESNQFLYHFLTFKKEQIISTYLQGGQGNLSGNIIKSIILMLPNLREQKKIANCLSSLDELITAQSQKIDALKSHKKSLMQQLFPNENESTPKLRFPEFKKAGAWEKKRLGEVLKAETSMIAQNKLNFVKKGYPVYGASGLLGYILMYEQNEDYIAIIKDGSGVGKLFFYKKKSSILGSLTYLKLKNNNHCLTYSFYLLQIVNFSKHIKGSGIPHIYFRDYANELIPLPSLAEQKKIADCLSSLDELITAESQKIEALKSHKKGLMQQLFPVNQDTTEEEG